MKKSILLIILLFPLFVSAADLSYFDCVYNYQDQNKNATGTGTFSYCMKAVCNNGIWQTYYAQNKSLLVCANGNIDMYSYDTINGCSEFIGACNSSANTEAKYCYKKVSYDCDKINNGSIYIPRNTTTNTIIPSVTTTTTKKKNTTKKTTTKVTTTTTTVVPKDNNNYLKSLSVDGYAIDFNKDKLTYSVELDKNIDELNIKYELESDKSNVTISNDKNININSPILIRVTAEDGSVKDYTINVKYKTLSNNTLVNNILIEGYEFAFKNDVYTYDLIIKETDNKLNFNVELDDKNSNYYIIDNDNLVNGSVVKVNVVAEDKTSVEYIFNIIVETPKKESNNSVSSVFTTIIIIIIVGVIGFVGFKFIRNILPARKDDKYDYE